MVNITVNNLGKKYANEWIFKDLSVDLIPGNRYAVKGPNGSGKSTLLKVLSGYLTPSMGEIIYTSGDKVIHRDDIYRNIAFAAPYLDLIDAFTVREMILFQSDLGKFPNSVSADFLLDYLYLRKASNTQLWELSSGMIQRLRLGLAICSTSDILILDEPGTNLDEKALNWYYDAIQKYAKDRLVIVASNDESDFVQPDEILNVMEYKKVPSGKN